MSLVLDAGAFVQIERRDRHVGAMIRVAQQKKVALITSGGVVAQVWRDGARQTLIERVLTGCAISPLDGDSGRKVGQLLAQSRTSDVVDAHLALLASPGDQVLTSDPGDLSPLLDARKIKAAIVAV